MLEFLKETIASIPLLLCMLFPIFHLINSREYVDEYYTEEEIDEKSISVLVPCYNEEFIVQYTIKGLQSIDYENYEVIFINDGSSDNTLEVMNDNLNLVEVLTSDIGVKYYKSMLYDNIHVIDKHNGGKADSLNHGINYANNEFVCTMDADCILKKDALKIINTHLQDNDVIATGGSVNVMQLFKLKKNPSILLKLQSLDLIKAFYTYKPSLSVINSMSIISGAFGVFRKSVFKEVGYFKSTLGEDMDMTLRFQEYASNNNKKVTYAMEAVCYTECPESFKDLAKQRIRWQKAFVDSIILNKEFVFKNFFKSRLSFHLIVEALFVATFSTTLLFSNYIGALIGQKNLKLLIFSLLFIAIVDIIYLTTSISRAKEWNSELDTKRLYPAIVVDLLVTRIVLSSFFVIGTVSYLFNKRSWNKVSRCDNNYHVDN